MLSLALAFSLCGGLDMALAIAPPLLFRVDAIPSKTEVRVNEPFKVALRVENTTSSNQTVRVMSCSWLDEWQFSNTNVIPNPWNCTRNFPVDVSIPPGGAHTNELEMRVDPSFSGQTLSFRMGFTPIGSPTTFWSDDVALKIMPTATGAVPAGSSVVDKASTEDISGALRDCERIKPGMTRAQLLELFTTEGGLSTARHRTYVYRRCPYIKVNVDFNPAKPDQSVLDEQMSDTISGVSKPYLEWSISD